MKPRSSTGIVADERGRYCPFRYASTAPPTVVVELEANRRGGEPDRVLPFSLGC
jgi:hypothetical protein